MIGRRFVESEQYLKARAAGHLASGEFDLDWVPVASAAETRSALRLRTYSDLSPFDIEGTPAVGELPAAAHLPSAVETIPTDHIQVELATETSENALGTAVNDGTAYSEVAVNFGSTPTLTKLPRFGTRVPITLGQLDEPGIVSSIIDRRITLGVGLGLENEIINGNAFWSGAVASAGETVAKASTYRADAVCNGIAAVQGAGWYVNPLQVVVHPTTRANIYTERDTAGRPLGVSDMLDDQVDNWIISKEIPVGEALVGDFFEGIGLFTHGELEIAVSKNHADFFARGMVALTIGFRCYSWVRQPTALCLVTGL